MTDEVKKLLNSNGKQRIVQEYVPGKQVTLAHIIRNPRDDICDRIGIDNKGAIGIMTITPGEGAIIAADIASKTAAVHIEFVDRFTGCVIISGDVSSVEVALYNVVKFLHEVLGFFPAKVTSS
ncbi:MAG: BMC domain-containing protein [Synergistetes bacterium]|nr:BMC domain-containing protein [Synergistota bacterium]MCX8127763.1 BMC domain-containing protein [Synergistota bacterium]MDW8191321.1 BMC domain-containing protein [Synergistota bacterium]